MKTHSLKNGQIELTVMELGATVNSLKFKGQETVLRHDTEEEYIAASSFFGACIGRYGNRIGNARFTLDGKEYLLAANEGKNQLHGGPGSYDRRYWTVEYADEETLRLSILSPDGDNGFPGTLKMTVIYTLLEDGIRVVFLGGTDKPTVFAPTIHPYFTYRESAAIRINADSHLAVDEGLIPTGELLPCEGKFDFHELRKLDLSYDDAFVLNGSEALEFVSDNYTMKMITDFPAAQMYTGKAGGVALEPEAFPDSPNHPNFPSTVLRPGEVFEKFVEYRFSER